MGWPTRDDPWVIVETTKGTGKEMRAKRAKKSYPTAADAISSAIEHYNKTESPYGSPAQHARYPFPNVDGGITVCVRRLQPRSSEYRNQFKRSF